MNDSTYEQSLAEKTVGEIVAGDYRTAAVFEGHGIDFCCGGKATLADACREKGLDLAALEQELAAVTREKTARSQNFADWALPFLADYIINIHHAYLNDNLSQIVAYTGKIAEVHGDRHPEVVRIADIFAGIAADMAGHLREEEEVLFPAIRRIDTAKRAGASPAAEDEEAIRSSLSKLDHEHQEIGEAVHAIRDLAHDYAVPEDVCNTFMVTYQKLKEFEEDLHMHVHLENNILFPRAAGQL